MRRRRGGGRVPIPHRRLWHYLGTGVCMYVCVCVQCCAKIFPYVISSSPHIVIKYVALLPSMGKKNQLQYLMEVSQLVMVTADFGPTLWVSKGFSFPSPFFH